MYTTIFSKDMMNWMTTVEMSFLAYDGGANRYDIQWSNISDFFYNSLWGVPQGFIGPTLIEVIYKTTSIPRFSRGCRLFVCIMLSVYTYIKPFSFKQSIKSAYLSLFFCCISNYFC